MQQGAEDLVNQLGLGRLLEQDRQRHQYTTALILGGGCEQRAQGFEHFGRPVQQGQQLQRGLVCLHRAGNRLAPGLGCDQGLVTSACLDGDRDNALEQHLVLGTPGSVEQHLESHARLA